MNVILKALMVSVWFMALTFPLVVMKVDALNDTILFRWENMATIGVGAFVLSIFWRWSMERKARGVVSTGPSLFARTLEHFAFASTFNTRCGSPKPASSACRWWRSS